MTIERYSHSPKSITFFGGVFIPIIKENYSLTKISRIQKNLRQSFWQYLTENNLNNQNYLLKVDAPVRVTGSKVYLELLLCFEPIGDDNLASHQALCEHYMRELTIHMQS